MNRTICIALMALPLHLYNAKLGFAISGDVPIVKNQLSIITTLIACSTNGQSQTLTWQISARDDQTEDCLRTGICKD